MVCEHELESFLRLQPIEGRACPSLVVYTRSGRQADDGVTALEQAVGGGPMKPAAPCHENPHGSSVRVRRERPHAGRGRARSSPARSSTMKSAALAGICRVEVHPRVDEDRGHAHDAGEGHAAHERIAALPLRMERGSEAQATNIARVTRSREARLGSELRIVVVRLVEEGSMCSVR